MPKAVLPHEDTQAVRRERDGGHALRHPLSFGSGGIHKELRPNARAVRLRG